MAQLAGTSLARAGTDYLSDDPSHRLEVTRQGSTWSEMASGQVLSHEFGHVLGLHDGYVLPDKTMLRPGATRDHMFHQDLPISAEMITRVVRRNGGAALNESAIVCPLTYDAGPASVNLVLGRIDDMTIHACAPDYDPPSDDPGRKPRPIMWTGTASYAGGVLTSMGFVSGPLSGPVQFSSMAYVPYAFILPGYNGGVHFSSTFSWASDGLPVEFDPIMVNRESSRPLFGDDFRARYKHTGIEGCQP